MSSDSLRGRAWVAVVTGMSGAGKTTAVQALEDEGFFCIDNLPPSLIDQAIKTTHAAGHTKIGLVLDARAGQSLIDVPKVLAELERGGHLVDVIFLEALDEVLIRRFSETRRRHPVETLTVSESIARERLALDVMRGLATRLIDTSSLSRHELRKLVFECVAHDAARSGPNVTIVSFGFKFGLPAEADMVFDVRHLGNPFFVPTLKALSGRDAACRSYVLTQADASEFLRRINDLLRYLVPLYRREGKSYLTVAIGCTGGRHRSVAVAEALGSNLGQATADLGITVTTRHRDIERL